MSMTIPRPSPADAPRASRRIQTRRILLLARLLTAVSGIGCSLAYVLLMTWAWLTPQHDHAPEMCFVDDLRFWIGVFAFWVAVIWLARRPLRLDA